MAPLAINHAVDEQPLMDRMKRGYNPMTEGVRWSEKYDQTLERLWSRLPRVVSTTLATVAVFLMGTSIQGTHNDAFLYTTKLMVLYIMSFQEIGFL